MENFRDLQRVSLTAVGINQPFTIIRLIIHKLIFHKFIRNKNKFYPEVEKINSGMIMPNQP